MTEQDVYENLCIHDKRHPDYDAETVQRDVKKCFCDNCFYGRHRLAVEVLKRWGKAERQDYI